MKKIFILITGLLAIHFSYAQYEASVSVTVVTEQQKPLSSASVELVSKNSATVVQSKITDSLGKAEFKNVASGSYFCRISYSGFNPFTTEVFSLSNSHYSYPLVVLQPSSKQLSNVTVSAKKLFMELQLGKTVINLDASITLAGTTVLEALQKVPGVAVDRDGNIFLKGKANVLVMIDGRITNLSASQLATLLSGMNSSSLSQIELMEQPPARYDAAGTAGIINLITKKNLQKGFNGSVTTSYGQGRYSQNNNYLQLNYRNGKLGLFANYSTVFSNDFTNSYEYRTYYKPDGSIASILEQPNFLKIRNRYHNVRVGADYTLSNKTSLSASFAGMVLNINNYSYNPATWMNAQRMTDSLLFTSGPSANNWKRAGGNLSLKHSFSASNELTADIDVLGYSNNNTQFLQNSLIYPTTYSDSSKAFVPSNIQILAAKTDYSKQLKNIKIESGIKVSRTATDNTANYFYKTTGPWQPDYGKSNRFLYTENIQAAYVSANMKQRKWAAEGGLRFEATAYNARQMGNPLRKDSSFSRRYNNLFPSFSTSYEADSNNTFSLTAGRRIDRPAFQKLNPFILIVNKYSYGIGNPYYRPQYTWNTELSHSYKNILITSIGYSVTTNFFSKLYLNNNGIVIYTEGNLGKLQQYSFSSSAQVSPRRWWSLSALAAVTHKELDGVVLGKQMHSSITQFSMNASNQFQFKKGWSAQLTAYYESRSQYDIQEFLDPSGLLSAGIAKTLLKNKVTLKLSFNDILYTQWIKGNTTLYQATEYFKLSRNSRTGVISLSYRFGKAFKTARRSEGSASEETQRVGH